MMNPHELKPEHPSSPPEQSINTPFPHQLIDLVSHARRQLAHNPVYAPNLFGYQAILDQITYHASLGHSAEETSSSIQRAMMTEMKRVDMFYNQRLADIKAQLEACQIVLPSPSATKPSLSNLAWAFAHLLYQHHHSLYTRVVAEAVRQVVDREAESYTYHDADHAAMKADGMTVEWLDQLKALMHVAESIDTLRQYCMTTAVEACAITALTYDSDDCFWQVHPMALQPYAKGDGLHSLNAILQQILDGFLPRQSENGICPVSHTPTLAPVILTTCSHRFDLLSFYPFFGRHDQDKKGQCPVCSRPWDMNDQLIADSSLTKLDYIRGNAAPPFPSPALPMMHNMRGQHMMHQSGDANLNEVIKAASNSGATVNVQAAFKFKTEEGEEIERGVSCHQCKTNKPKSALLFCTTKADGLRKRRCRKKYCDSCLRRSYNQSISTMMTEELMTWVCPSCTKSCTCAACVRRTPGRRDTDGEPQQQYSYDPSGTSGGVNDSMHEDGQPHSPSGHAGQHNVRAGAGAAAAHQLHQDQLQQNHLMNQHQPMHNGQPQFHQSHQMTPSQFNQLIGLPQTNQHQQHMENMASMFTVPTNLIPSMPSMQSHELSQLTQTGDSMTRTVMPIVTNPADQAD